MRLKKVIKGFIDTIKLAKLKLGPKVTNTGPLNFKLGTLVTHVFGPHYHFDAHNAEGDVLALQHVVEALKFTPTQFSASCHSFSHYKKLQNDSRKAKNSTVQQQ